MQNEMPTPVDHGVLSATGTVAAEAGSSGLKGMLGGALALPVITGGLFGLTALYWNVSTLLAGATAVGSTMTAGAIATGALSAVGWAAVFTGIGAVVSLAAITTVIPAIAGLGAIFGLAKGASRGAGRVSQEQGAANTLQAQVSAMQAQAMAMNAAPVDARPKYNFPPQGDMMNPAGSSISNVQRDGVIADRGLQLA